MVYSSEQFLGIPARLFVRQAGDSAIRRVIFLERVGTDTEIEASTARYFGDVLSRYSREN